MQVYVCDPSSSLPNYSCLLILQSPILSLNEQHGQAKALGSSGLQDPLKNILGKNLQNVNLSFRCQGVVDTVKPVTVGICLNKCAKYWGNGGSRCCWAVTRCYQCSRTRTAMDVWMHFLLTLLLTMKWLKEGKHICTYEASVTKRKKKIMEAKALQTI